MHARGHWGAVEALQHLTAGEQNLFPPHGLANLFCSYAMVITVAGGLFLTLMMIIATWCLTRAAVTLMYDWIETQPCYVWIAFCQTFFLRGVLI